MLRLLECSNATLSCFSPLFFCQDDLSSHWMKCCGFFFFLFFLSFFFLPLKALNRNLSLGLYFCIPASITITSEAGMIGRISRKNQDYELGLCKLEQKSWLTTGNLWENFHNAHFLAPHTSAMRHWVPGFLKRLRGQVFHRTGFLKSESHQQPER